MTKYIEMLNEIPLIWFWFSFFRKMRIAKNAVVNHKLITQ
jgi:hypothetical protein